MKKALALILSLLMVLGLLPAAIADGEPVVASATLMTELPQTGDRVVIHNTTNNKALDACGTNSYYNAGVDIVPADGKLSGVSENIVWDVTKNEDGSYRFSQNGRARASAARPMTTSTRTGRSNRTATATASRTSRVRYILSGMPRTTISAAMSESTIPARSTSCSTSWKASSSRSRSQRLTDPASICPARRSRSAARPRAQRSSGRSARTARLPNTPARSPSMRPARFMHMQRSASMRPTRSPWFTRSPTATS